MYFGDDVAYKDKLIYAKYQFYPSGDWENGLLYPSQFQESLPGTKYQIWEIEEKTQVKF